MKKILMTIMTIGLVAGIGLAGCGKQENEATASTEKTEQNLPTKDRSGKEISLPKEATKIVSLVPSVTEVIDDIGKTNELVAVDMQSGSLNEALQALPQMDMMAIDAEKLIALKPQIVYVNDINLASSESVWQQVEDAGITIVNIPTSTSIQAITSVTTSTQKRADSCPIRTSSIKTKSLSRKIEYEIRHLKHLLYFPMLRDDTFPAELWLYFEKQQAWLENIIQGKFSVIEQAIDQEQVVIESSQRRQWDYSSKEIQLQLNKILFLFEEKPDRRYQYFQEWADALIQTMTVVKLN